MAIGKGGTGIHAENALDHVYGYAVGVDLTRRDLQTAAKASGKPWDAAKGFDESAPVSSIVPIKSTWRVPSPNDTIQLLVNGSCRQNGTLQQMIWSIPEIIQKCSEIFTLCPGDLIFTGTPAGVGPLVPGDHVHAEILGDLDVSLDFVVANPQ